MVGFEAHPAWLHFGKRSASARRISVRVRLSFGLLGGVLATLVAAGTPLPARAAPDTERHVLADPDHNFVVERPQDVGALLDAFLARHARPN